ncbi:MAG: SURF1 family protein [Burkholderiaceae bacterium]
MSPKARFWLLTLGALVGVALTLSLGRWQLSRAAQKEALQAAIEAKQRQPALDGQALGGPDPLAQLVHRRIRLRGRWLAQQTVFLDNRQMHGRPGFFVLTPLQLEGSTAVALVQRGWVQRNFVDRSALPRIDTPQGLVAIEGRIAPPPSKLYEFKASEPGPIRQNLDLAEFSAETRLPLLGLSVVQTGAPSEGLQRDWPEAGSGADKHYGYAFQWLGLSSLIAILYVWFQFIAPRRRQARRS